jgi:signal peptidase I
MVFREVRNFLKKDSWASTLVWLVLLLILIRFIIFPFLNWAAGTDMPLVIVESCSMYHSKSVDSILQNYIYKDYGISSFNGWLFQNGIKKGDIVFVTGRSEVEVGDVIVFNGGNNYPIIHRVVYVGDGFVRTKGDNNDGMLPVENNIPNENILGEAKFRVPYLGWVKLIFFDFFKPRSEQGPCAWQ